jgi:hypothetical protein
MRNKLVAVIALLAVTGLLSGCIIVPADDGYRHHHHYDRY